MDYRPYMTLEERVAANEAHLAVLARVNLTAAAIWLVAAVAVIAQVTTGSHPVPVDPNRMLMEDMNATSAHGEGVQFFVRPKCLVFMAIAAVGTSAVFFVLWPIILGLFGWTSIGPAAGSAAAAWQVRRQGYEGVADESALAA